MGQKARSPKRKAKQSRGVGPSSPAARREKPARPRATAAPPWRAVVVSAIESLRRRKLPLDLRRIYDTVAIEQLRPLPAHWRSKVRQVLRQLTREVPPFVLRQLSPPQAGHTRELIPGKFRPTTAQQTGLPSDAVLAMLVEHCERAGLDIAAARQWAHPSQFMQPHIEHSYEISFVVASEDDGDGEDLAENLTEEVIIELANATHALAQWYAEDTAVQARIFHVIRDSDPWAEWVTLAYARTPRVAGGQLAFAIDTLLERKGVEVYKLIRVIEAFTWTVKEPMPK
jgi:hypothetical protein